MRSDWHDRQGDMDAPAWQDEAIETLRAMFADDPRVVALGVFGSLANTAITPDRWSDVDLLVVVADDAFEAFQRSTAWIAAIGEVFAVDRQGDDRQATIRVIFTDFRKIDLVIATPSAIDRRSVRFPNLRLLLNRNEGLVDRLRDAGDRASPDAPSPLPEMIDAFWFLAYTAVAKAMRRDLLIALHLALDLHRMTLVLGMLLRDRDLGTTVHRVGGPRNDLAETHIDVTTRRDILAVIERGGQVFDALAADQDPTYRERSSVFRTVIDRAREDLAGLGE